MCLGKIGGGGKGCLKDKQECEVEARALSDIDLGEMFLNYTLGLDIWAYAGVDVTEVDIVKEGRKRVIEKWTRTLMGFRLSPYIATQMFAWSKEVIIGDYSDPSNPFFWDKIVFNQPGTQLYDPSLTWIYKWNSIQNCLSGFFSTYINDIQTGHSSEEDCKLMSRRVSS